MQGLFFRKFFKNSRIFTSLQFSYKTLSDADLKLTEACVKKIEEKTTKTLDKFLRLTVEAGGYIFIKL